MSNLFLLQDIRPELAIPNFRVRSYQYRNIIYNIAAYY